MLFSSFSLLTLPILQADGRFWIQGLLRGEGFYKAARVAAKDKLTFSYCLIKLYQVYC